LQSLCLLVIFSSVFKASALATLLSDLCRSRSRNRRACLSVIGATRRIARHALADVASVRRLDGVVRWHLVVACADVLRAVRYAELARVEVGRILIRVVVALLNSIECPLHVDATAAVETLPDPPGTICAIRASQVADALYCLGRKWTRCAREGRQNADCATAAGAWACSLRLETLFVEAVVALTDAVSIL